MPIEIKIGSNRTIGVAAVNLWKPPKRPFGVLRLLFQLKPPNRTFCRAAEMFYSPTSWSASSNMQLAWLTTDKLARSLCGRYVAACWHPQSVVPSHVICAVSALQLTAISSSSAEGSESRSAHCSHTSCFLPMITCNHWRMLFFCLPIISTHASPFIRIHHLFLSVESGQKCFM